MYNGITKYVLFFCLASLLSNTSVDSCCCMGQECFPHCCVLVQGCEYTKIHPFSSGGIFQLFPVWRCYVARDILLHPLVHNCTHCLLGTHLGAGLAGHRVPMNSALWGPAQLSPPRTVPIYTRANIVQVVIILHACQSFTLPGFLFGFNF